MTLLISWNIQNGKGVDGVISLARIAADIRAMGDADVICLQEISRGLTLDSSGARPDQIGEMAELFPGYTIHFGAAVETGATGGSWQFGNATLSRLPVRSVFRHALPQPAAPGIKHMARMALELNVETAAGLLRIVNTHLEYHSFEQRLAQVARLIEIDFEIAANRLDPPAYTATGTYADVGRTVEAVICGDFNMTPFSTEYGGMLRTGPAPVATLVDAWPVLHPATEHAATCGIHDRVQWPEGPHCRDYFFVTRSIAQSARRIGVDAKTAASDHQPIFLDF